GLFLFFFFSSRRRHTRFDCDWSSDVCSSDLGAGVGEHGFGDAALLLDELDRLLDGLAAIDRDEPRAFACEQQRCGAADATAGAGDRKSTRLNSSHSQNSYAVFCLKKKKNRPGRPSSTASRLSRPR